MSAETSVKGMDSILLQINAKKIFKDKEFLEKLSKAKTPEEIIELFKTKEIILSLEQVQEIVKRGEKLSEEDLENVSGGVDKKIIIGGVAAVGLTVLAGLGLAAGAAAAAPYVTEKCRECTKDSLKKLQEVNKANGAIKQICK